MALLALGCRGLEISLRQYVENGISPSKIVLGARRGHCGHHFHHPVSIGTLPAGWFIVAGLPWYGYDYTCDDLGLWQRNGSDVVPGSLCKPHGGTRGVGARQAPYWKQMDILRSGNQTTTGLIYNDTTVSVHFDFFPEGRTGPRHQVGRETIKPHFCE